MGVPSLRYHKRRRLRPGEWNMIIHDPRFALNFTFRFFIQELPRDPGELIPAFIVLSMINYIGFECLRPLRYGPIERRPEAVSDVAVGAECIRLSEQTIVRQVGEQDWRAAMLITGPAGAALTYILVARLARQQPARSG